MVELGSLMFCLAMLVGVPDGQAKQLGFDPSQLNDIRSRNSHRLTGADAQPLRALQLLVDDWDSNQLEQLPPLRLVDLLADTSDSVVRRVRLVGRVRQCVKIKTDDGTGPESSLFQLTIFPDLDGQTITVKAPDGSRVAYGRFAVTVRASSLPPGETSASLLDQRVRVDGVHYRFWRYDSVFANQQNLNGQIGALVLAGPIAVLANSSTREVEQGLMGLLCVVAMGLALMGWWYWEANRELDQTYDALPDLLPDDWKAD